MLNTQNTSQIATDILLSFESLKIFKIENVS